MAMVTVRILLQGGAVHEAELPDDEPVGWLLPQLVEHLDLPTTRKDGTRLIYSLTSESTKARLLEDTDLRHAGVPAGDTLRLIGDPEAG